MKNAILMMFLLLTAFNTHAQTFKKKADFPGGTRQKLASAALGTKVYCGAGADSNNVLQNDFWQYETTTNTWTQKSDLPFAPRRNTSALTIAGNLYVGFGWDGTTDYKDWWMYNASSDTWTKKADLPSNGRYWSGMFEWGGEGYLIGGGSQGAGYAEYKDVWKYTPATNTWTAQPDFTGTARAGAFCQRMNNMVVYGLGGAGSIGSWLSTVYKYNLTTKTWTSLPPVPASASAPVVDGNAFWSASAGSKLVLMNVDYDAPTLDDHNSIFVFDTTTNTWTVYPLANVASFRTWGICAQSGNKAYVGSGVVDMWYKDMWEVDLAGFTTSIENNNPGLKDICIYSYYSKIQTNIPEDVFAQNGTLQLNIYSTDGKTLASYTLKNNELLDVPFPSPANYVYLLQSKSTPLKSGMIVLQ